MPLKIWNGSAYADPSQYRIWNGSAFVAPQGVYEWDGTKFVSLLSSLARQRMDKRPTYKSTTTETVPGWVPNPGAPAVVENDRQLRVVAAASTPAVVRAGLYLRKAGGATVVTFRIKHNGTVIASQNVTGTMALHSFEVPRTVSNGDVILLEVVAYAYEPGTVFSTVDSPWWDGVSPVDSYIEVAPV